MNGLGGLHPSSLILGFLQVASSLQMEMGPQLRMVANRMLVPSASIGVRKRNEKRERLVKRKTTNYSCLP